MATQYNILERYGIKEVADVTFIDIDTGYPVLYLDSLKVSTIEETAESTEARGGKGNAPLLSWDYGKEINVSITDALYSPKSLALMHSQNLSDLHVYNPGIEGNTANSSLKAREDDLKVTKYRNVYVDNSGNIQDTNKNAATYISAAAASASGAQALLEVIGVPAREYDTVSTGVCVFRAEDNLPYTTGAAVQNSSFSDILNGQVYIVSYDVIPSHKARLEISAEAFPGTYKVVGDTYARNNRTGKDQYFQFVINKAKMNPETTITLEAEGDATVFDMSLKVLRPDNGIMMELIQYDFDDAENTTTNQMVNVHHSNKEQPDLYNEAGKAGDGFTN